MSGFRIDRRIIDGVLIFQIVISKFEVANCDFKNGHETGRGFKVANCDLKKGLSMTKPGRLIPIERIVGSILLVRGQKVLLDSDLAEMYGVSTGRLNQQVRRNCDRFPDDFMFQLTAEEAEALRSQIAILKTGRGRHRKYAPYVFTEQGVAMLSSVLNSPGAVQVNIAIMRAFVQLREMMASHKDLARKLEEMEKKYDAQFKVVFDAIRELMTPPPAPSKRRIGFLVE